MNMYIRLPFENWISDLSWPADEQVPDSEAGIRH